MKMEHENSCNCGHNHDISTKYTIKPHKNHEHAEKCCGDHCETSGHSHRRGPEFEPECGCSSCKHNEDKNDDGMKLEIAVLIAGSLLFALSFAFESPVRIVMMLTAYILLGTEVLINAVKDLFRGGLFSENFLMSIATICAVCIGEYPEAAGVMLFFRVGELFQNLAVNRSKKSIVSLLDLIPDRVIILDGNKEKEMDPEDVRVGEIILVKPGERIPLDGEIILGESYIDYSALTGESVPVCADAGSAVMSGGVNTSGVIRVKATKLLGESTAARIMSAVMDASQGKPKVERFITRFSKVYTPSVVAAAVLVAVLPPLFGWGSFESWLKSALMFLVISCPCALVISVPLSLFAGLGSASKKGILFKGANHLEILSMVNAVGLDKTGTLTKGTFEVDAILPANGYTEGQLLNYAAALEKMSIHPVAKAISAQCPNIRAADEVREIAGEGVSGMVNGERVLAGNSRLMKENGISGTLEAKGTIVHVAADNRYMGLITVKDKLKPNSKQAVSRLTAQGLEVALLTGDNETTATEIEDEVGIKRVYHSLMPEDKLKKIHALREEKGRVLFVGDGINDSPVLAGADIGMAVALGGTDAAMEAADVVLFNEDISSIPEAIDISKRTMRKVRANIAFALAVKAAAMILGILGYAELWMAVFADAGTALLCIMNSMLLLRQKRKK